MRYFEYALALELGMTRAALIEQITLEELLEWSKFFEIKAAQLKKQAQTQNKPQARRK